MRYALLYGAELSDLSEFHREVAKKLEFPAWYGCNPDALYDCLTDIISDTTLVVFDAELFAAKDEGVRR